jgi:hypothetical protein
MTTFDDTVYVVRYGWLMAAFTLVALACLAILLTYWRWWLLGRPVSLSPLETARAFDAHLLRKVDANGTSSELTRAIGHVRVRYQSTPPCEDRLVGENCNHSIELCPVRVHSVRVRVDDGRVDCSSTRPVSADATLLRWTHPTSR